MTIVLKENTDFINRLYIGFMKRVYREGNTKWEQIELKHTSRIYDETDF